MVRRTIVINRPPVLTLWASVVARRLGFQRDEALTLGRAVANLVNLLNPSRVVVGGEMAACAEMVRVTRPGGRVAILEFSQPRGRVFGRLYRFYFRRIMPLIGQAISRSKDNAYRYLPASVQEFPDGEALAERLRGHGLTAVRWYPFTFGIATLYVGTKP